MKTLTQSSAYSTAPCHLNGAVCVGCEGLPCRLIDLYFSVSPCVSPSITTRERFLPAAAFRMGDRRRES